MVEITSNSDDLTFPHRMRLSGRLQFAKVYDAKTRASAGPLLVYGSPNDLAFPRLGLAVPGRVGTNVKRNLIKRRLREAFRLMQHHWPKNDRGYDLVINVRPHEAIALMEYQALLADAIVSLQKAWTRKRDKPQD